jgi:hypothetical protein
LRRGQRLVDILLHGGDIERGEFLRIVEIRAIGVRRIGMLAQRPQIEKLRPPILVGGRFVQHRRIFGMGHPAIGVTATASMAIIEIRSTSHVLVSSLMQPERHGGQEVENAGARHRRPAAREHPRVGADACPVSFRRPRGVPCAIQFPCCVPGETVSRNTKIAKLIYWVTFIAKAIKATHFRNVTGGNRQLNVPATTEAITPVAMPTSRASPPDWTQR